MHFGDIGWAGRSWGRSAVSRNNLGLRAGAGRCRQVEYALNDFQDAGQSLGNWDNHTRRAIERLLRKLLQYPKRPALIVLGAFPHRYYDPGCAGQGLRHP